MSSRSSWASPAGVAVAASVAVAAATSSLASTVVLDNTSGLTVGPSGAWFSSDFDNYDTLVSFQTSSSGSILDSISLHLSNSSPGGPATGTVAVSLIETTTNAHTGTVVASETVGATIATGLNFHTFDFSDAIAQTTLTAGVQYSLRIDGSAFADADRIFVRGWPGYNTPSMDEEGGFAYLGSWGYLRNSDDWFSQSAPYSFQLTATTNAVPGVGGLAGVFALAVASRRRRREGFSA